MTIKEKINITDTMNGVNDAGKTNVDQEGPLQQRPQTNLENTTSNLPALTPLTRSHMCFPSPLLSQQLAKV